MSKIKSWIKYVRKDTGYKRENIQEGKEGGGGGRSELKMKLLYILFFLDCLTLIILKMTGIVILIVKNKELLT